MTQQSQQRLDQLVRLLGAQRLAVLLGVRSSALSAAIAGKRELSLPAIRRALDLERLVYRALQIMEPEVIVDWLEGMEPSFAFGRPIDVFTLRGSAPLLVVLDRIASGGYA